MKDERDQGLPRHRAHYRRRGGSARAAAQPEGHARPAAALGRRMAGRAEGAGKTHDAERDPGHYIDLTDDGKVMGDVPIAMLPVTREVYDTQLGTGGSTQ